MENYEIQGLLHENFRRQVKETPNKIAVIAEGEQYLTFLQVNFVEG